MQGSKKSLESRTGLEEIASCAIISSTPDPQVTAVSTKQVGPEHTKIFAASAAKRERSNVSQRSAIAFVLF